MCASYNLPVLYAGVVLVPHGGLPYALLLQLRSCYVRNLSSLGVFELFSVRPFACRSVSHVCVALHVTFSCRFNQTSCQYIAVLRCVGLMCVLGTVSKDAAK